MSPVACYRCGVAVIARGEAVLVACVQNCAQAEPDRNIAICRDLALRAAGKGAEIICLPEYFSGVTLEAGRFIPAAFPADRHPVLQAFAELARDQRRWLLLGSVGVTAGDNRVFNRSYLLSPDGAPVAHYDKIHLFDVDLDAGYRVRESATIEPGKLAVIARTPLASIGLTICYDLRFAQLYRALAKAGAEVLAIPAAFTRRTGEAHWHVLCRARAIETGSYVVAPCQYGTLPGGGQCFGHSLIVDPWGRVLADGGDSEAIILAEIDPDQVRQARQRIPALAHDRPFEAPQAE